MDVKIEDSWKTALQAEFGKLYFEELLAAVQKEYGNGATVYPREENIFKAFELCPFEKVKVVILGQDPYHGEGQAHGLSFSVPEGVRPPPSLQNIYKELHTDLDTSISQSGNLERWAAQGVLLLNATLTVLGGKPGSHQGLGWEKFTDAAIKALSDDRENLVFILWGRYAQDKGAVIDDTKHLVIKSPHPSPFSAYTGFFGSKPFSKTNEYLKAHEHTPIVW